MEDKDDFKVDFIGIGVSRAATTWIWECLREHPQLCLPPFKRGAFFLDETYQVDRKYFAKCEPGQKKGEINADYYMSAEIASQIKNLFPEIKLIISFRNPIEAIYSLYFYNKSFGREKATTFENAIKKSPHYIERGFYYRHLVPYLKLFPKEQFLFLTYEDIQKDPIAFIQSIFKFLEVDSTFVPLSSQKKVNLTPPPVLLSKLYGKTTTFLRQHRITDKIFNRIKSLKLRGAKEIIFRKIGEFQRPPMKTGTRERLQQIFAQDIENLEKLINRDLSFWK